MRLASLVGALALALGVHQAAAAAAAIGDPADRWIFVAKEPSGDTDYFDALTVQRVDGIVTFWGRSDFAKPQKLKDGKTYVSLAVETSTECGSNWTASKTIVALDEKGDLVKKIAGPGTHETIVARSSTAQMQAAVCRFDARLEALRPQVIGQLAADPQWAAFGGLKTGVTGAVSRASVQRKAGGMATAVVRFAYPDARTGPDGYPFRNMYVRFDIDCEHVRVRQRESDYTDDNERLVGSQAASPSEPLGEIKPGQPGEHVRDAACDTPAGQPAAGAVAASTTQTWTYVTTDTAKIEYSVDLSSIRQHGNYVESWQREVLPKPARNRSGKVYSIILDRMLDDCAGRTSGMLEMIFTDAKGAVMQSIDFPEAKMEFHSVPPESVSQAIQERVCGYARRMAGLKPNFNRKRLAEEEWVPLGSNANYSENALDRSTIRRTGSSVLYLTRSVARTNLKNENGIIFRTMYTAWHVDCDQSSARSFAVDYYDDQDVLVDVTVATNSASDAMAPITPSSSLEVAKNIACAVEDDGQDGKQGKGQDQQADGEPELYSGTAWLGPKGYLITASHVVRGATTILVAQDGHPVGEAEVVVDDPSNDVAILRPTFDKPGLHPLIALAPSPAMLGEHVFTLGYPAPDDLGLSIKLTSGDVSSLKGSSSKGGTDDARLMQISVPVQHGNSGGPLFDERGQAIGIIVAGFGPDSGLQNVNYAIKIAYARNLLAELPDLGGYRPLRPSASVTGLAADLQKSIFMLVVAHEKEK